MLHHDASAYSQVTVKALPTVVREQIRTDLLPPKDVGGASMLVS